MNEKSVVISTTVPLSVWTEIKSKNLKFSQLIIKGLQSEKNFPALLERIGELEAKLQKYRNQLEITSEELYRMRGV